MTVKKVYPLLGLLLIADQGYAGQVPMGIPQDMPLELGGIAAVAALSLIIATQLIKRRK